MAKASERKGVRTEELACCKRTRDKEMESIRLNYLSFPVIKKIVCPTCQMVLPIRVYSRDDAESGSAAG
ncbi:MAG: hypothetical protein FJ144_01165 [Deltaproteobacteria bacterium]|nr:hypothetical protein [Deltaproteobacteria bacterium]